ncbi:hypothetical protein MP228_003675 [Amoeboaphelidium protococcarum]|nr:hypothetical protein MP228_003675 [Amoeboaphelidium protococcarum]
MLIEENDVNVDDDTASQNQSIHDEDLKVGKIKAFTAVSMIVGMMIGGGIFSAPSVIVKDIQNLTAVLFIWLSAGLVSTFGALIYAELGTMMTKSGGEQTYLQQTYGPMLAAVFSWMSCFVGKPSSFAIIVIVFANYAYPSSQSSNGSQLDATNYNELRDIWVRRLIAALLAVFLTLMNMKSNFGLRLQNISTAFKVVCIIVLLIQALIFGVTGKFQVLSDNFKSTTISNAVDYSLTPYAIVMALYQAFWSFDGWNSVNFVAAEVDNPSRNIPLAIGVSVPTVTVIYLCLNLAYFTVIPVEQIIDTSTIGLEFGSSFPFGRIFVTICVCVSTLSSANASLYTGARLAEAAADEQLLPRYFASLNRSHADGNPIRALSLQCALSLFFILSGSYESLVTLYGQIMWVFYAMTATCVFILRFRSPEKSWTRPFSVPLLIAGIFCAFGLSFAVLPLFTDTKQALISYSCLVAFALFYQMRALYNRRVKRKSSQDADYTQLDDNNEVSNLRDQHYYSLTNKQGDKFKKLQQDDEEAVQLYETAGENIQLTGKST